MKIGVLGGTFNPIHLGHMDMAKGAVLELGLSCVIFVPSKLPPHKRIAREVTFDQRMQMCQVACEGVNTLKVSDVELGISGISYTYIMLERLKKIYPNDELYFLMGADSFLALNSWKYPERIFELATMCVVPRGDEDVNELKKFASSLEDSGCKYCIMKTKCTDVSSSYLRENFYTDENILQYVPQKVYEYVVKHNFYRLEESNDEYKGYKKRDEEKFEQG